MGAKMLGIGWREKRALMVVEPPSYFGGVRVLEINDGVFVAIKEAGSPRLRCAMSHAGETELGGRIELFSVKAVEESGGGGPIEATVVKAQPYAGHVVETGPFFMFLLCLGSGKAL